MLAIAGPWRACRACYNKHVAALSQQHRNLQAPIGSRFNRCRSVQWRGSREPDAATGSCSSVFAYSIGYPVGRNVAVRSRKRGRSPGAGPAPGPRPAAPAAPSALPPPSSDRDARRAAAEAGHRSCVSRDCVGGRAWARGEDNCVVGGGTGCCRGPMIMRLNSLGTPARRAQDLLAHMVRCRIVP